jgi:hypothetical protein
MFVSPLYRSFVRRWKIISAAVAFCILLTGATWAQSSPAQAQTPSTPAQPQQPAAPPPQNQQPSGSDAATSTQDQQQSNSSQQGTAQNNDQPEPEGHITKQQA